MDVETWKSLILVMNCVVLFVFYCIFSAFVG